MYPSWPLPFSFGKNLKWGRIPEKRKGFLKNEKRKRDKFSYLHKKCLPLVFFLGKRGLFGGKNS